MKIPSLSSLQSSLSSLSATKSSNKERDIFTPSRDWLFALAGFALVLCFFVAHGLLLYGDVSKKDEELSSDGLGTSHTVPYANKLDVVLQYMQADQNVFLELKNGSVPEPTSSTTTTSVLP